MTCDIPAARADAAMTDLYASALPVSDYNRELNRLAAQLRAVAERLSAFADADPTLELLELLEARGHRRSDAAAAVLAFLGSPEGWDVPREACTAVAWVVRTAACDLEGVALTPRRR